MAVYCLARKVRTLQLYGNFYPLNPILQIIVFVALLLHVVNFIFCYFCFVQLIPFFFHSIIEGYFIDSKTHPSGMYSAVILSNFMKLCDHLHDALRGHSHHCRFPWACVWSTPAPGCNPSDIYFW